MRVQIARHSDFSQVYDLVHCICAGDPGYIQAHAGRTSIDGHVVALTRTLVMNTSHALMLIHVCIV
jgi:hypothetical protein